MIPRISFLCLTFLSTCLSAAEPSYVREVQPLLRKYCGGCHNEAEREGDFSVATYEALMKGTPDGQVLVPNEPHNSHLLKLITGEAEPKMPPDDQAQPTSADIETIRKWIAAGAKSDARTVPLSEQIMVPQLAADPAANRYITAMADLGNHLVAIGREGQCELRDLANDQVVMTIPNLPGKINQLRLSRDRQYLIIAGGIAGLGGQVVLVKLADRQVVARLQGHTDAIYCAALSPDNQLLCTGGYDRVAILWDWQTQTEVRRFVGHNGAIYDLDIDSQALMLATASADQTVKLWGLADGTRLDTLGQPEGEMLCVRFTPDAKHVLASGADSQLRLWELIDKQHPAINPLRISRFAHERPVTQLVFHQSDQLLSLSDDKTVKLWSLSDLTPIGVVTECSDVPSGVATAGDSEVIVADFSGKLTLAKLPSSPARGNVSPASGDGSLPSTARSSLTTGQEALNVPAEPTHELEPNSTAVTAQPIRVPARMAGVVSGENNGQADVDCYEFEAQAGVPWVIEIQAARDKSPLDSLVEVVDSEGKPVLRTRLQAVRESYFTFRGKDSTTIDDYRMHKWQEMELNELLYAGGEVVKLWMYPRGPDSGFKVYPGYGSRVTFFDTTPTAHALGEVAYIVRQLPAGIDPLPNGLPVFPVYYQNDDDGHRRLGKDSQLTFTAPADGKYVIRVRDARGFGGDDFKYQLIVRPLRPDFQLQVNGADMKLPVGSGREWQVTAKRLDDLTAPIEVFVEDVPAGIEVSNPLVIEAGQDIAYGNLYLSPDFKLPEGQDKLTLNLRAKSQEGDVSVEHAQAGKLTVTLSTDPEVRVKLTDAKDTQRELTELTILPGQTISARVVIDRQNETGPVSIGKEDAGRNLPHGSIVDNIGLNGLLITEGNSEREFFITAARWLPPQERLFHLRSESKNNPTSRSVLLRVLPGN